MPSDSSDLPPYGLVKAYSRVFCGGWEHQPAFCDFLRVCRKKTNLTLRAAARILRISHGQLTKLETGVSGKRSLNVGFLIRAADLYEIEIEEMAERAGFTPGPEPPPAPAFEPAMFKVFYPEAYSEGKLDPLRPFPPGARRIVPVVPVVPGSPSGVPNDLRERFARMVLRDEVRPRVLTEERLECLGPAVQEAFIEYAFKLETYLRGERVSVHELLRTPLECEIGEGQ